MTALNQQVLPTFFSPTGQLSILFLSCGFGESLHTSVWVRFRLALFSAMLASKTLKKTGRQKPTNSIQGKFPGHWLVCPALYLFIEVSFSSYPLTCSGGAVSQCCPPKTAPLLILLYKLE